MDCDARPSARGEGLELILDQGLALRGREPAFVVKPVHRHVSVVERGDQEGGKTHVSGSSHAAGLRCRAPVCVVTAVPGGMM